MKTLSLVAFCLLAAATAQPVHTRGIPDRLLSVYQTADNKFTCFDKSATISSSKVNDDFCDCPDGSDEPGTSACPNAKFYCKNKGARGKFIFALAVNDGVCDCCDGSDEYTGFAQCKNVCEEEGAEKRRALEEKLRAVESGAAKRAEYAQQGITAAQQRKEKLSQAVEEQAVAKVAREKLEEDLKAIEEKEQQETDRLRTEAAGKTVSVESALKLDTMTKEQLINLIIEHATSTATKDSLAASIQTLTGDASVAWPEESEVPVAYKSEEGNKARELLAAARAAETKLESDLRTLREEDTTDYGADAVFYALKGRCYDVKINQYTYQACPFGSAKQDYTSLGTFSGWSKNADGTTNYSEMSFTNGQGCWNGPNRSLKLKFKCGDTDALLSVDEPEKCAYEAQFSTPAVCDAKLVSDIKASMEHSDDAPVRDEL